MKERDKIVLVGDIHGQFRQLGYDIKRLYTDAHIIQVGDFGMGYHKPNYYKDELTKLSKTLEQTNCKLYAIRGNHDDPAYFAETNNPFDIDNITLLADYSELNLLGKSILCIGGAVSIDRLTNIPGESWWEGEKFNLKLEHEFPYRDRQYDLVLTHTRPKCCGSFKGFSNIAYWCENDPNLINELIEESEQLDCVYELTKPPKWCYGHFHESVITQCDNTVFKCLNIDEHYLYHYNE